MGSIKSSAGKGLRGFILEDFFGKRGIMFDLFEAYWTGGGSRRFDLYLFIKYWS